MRNVFRKPRFRLSTVFVLVALVSCALASRVHSVRNQIAVTNEIRTLGGEIAYDYELDANAKFVKNPQSPWPEWLLNAVGIDVFHSVVSVELSDKDPPEELLKRIGKIRGLLMLYFAGTNINNSTIQHLKDLQNLKILGLAGSHVTDAGLVSLSEMHELEYLDLQHQRVSERDQEFSDEGLKHLSKLKALKELYFYNANITDDGLSHLELMKNLELLWVYNSKVTEAGVAKLKRQIPGCKIGH